MSEIAKVKMIKSTTPPALDPMLDRNGTILKMGDKIQDAKGLLFKLDNVNGVAMVIYPIEGKPKSATVLRKADLANFVKVA